ncbi:MAG TPA: NAD(P)H-binding protein [Gemmatimonadaceae bacterium]|nr:NAD(P)H-binding protein [Gemmatimonadaceae bacterium]
MQIAFVAGATGYTGREVVRLLTARGVRTMAHVRPDSAKLEQWRRRFEADGAAVDSTPWRDADISQTLSALQPTHVFSLLGTTRARRRAAGAASSEESYEAIDFGLTAMLIRAAVASGSRPRFVYLSAFGVQEHTSNPYLVARWKAESMLRASGLPFTIARPSFITGPGRDESRPLERVAATVADVAAGVGRLFGAHRLAGDVQSVTGPELAAGLVRHAFDSAAENATLGAAELRVN